MKILFFDVETTGFSASDNATHQLSGYIDIDGEIREQFNFKIKPFEGAIIEESALQVSGVTLEQIMSYSEPVNVHQQLVTLLSKHATKYDESDKFMLAGYNNKTFDNRFLRAFFERNNDKCFDDWFKHDDEFDVIIKARKHFKNKTNKPEKFNLKSVAIFLGLSVDKERLHDAFYDIELTRQMYYILSNKQIKGVA